MSATRHAIRRSSVDGQAECTTDSLSKQQSKHCFQLPSVSAHTLSTASAQGLDGEGCGLGAGCVGCGVGFGVGDGIGRGVGAGVGCGAGSGVRFGNFFSPFMQCCKVSPG